RPVRRDRSKGLPPITLRPDRRSRNSSLGPAFQLVDQRLDLAAVVLDVGIEIRSSSHNHAHALDLDVDDARALPLVAHFPGDRDRLAIALVELALDERTAAPVGDTAQGQR